MNLSILMFGDLTLDDILDDEDKEEIRLEKEREEYESSPSMYSLGLSYTD
jgi:hypothetical protein